MICRAVFISAVFLFNLAAVPASPFDYPDDHDPYSNEPDSLQFFSIPDGPDHPADDLPHIDDRYASPDDLLYPPVPVLVHPDYPPLMPPVRPSYVRPPPARRPDYPPPRPKVKPTYAPPPVVVKPEYAPPPKPVYAPAPVDNDQPDYPPRKATVKYAPAPVDEPPDYPPPPKPKKHPKPSKTAVVLPRGSKLVVISSAAQNVRTGEFVVLKQDTPITLIDNHLKDGELATIKVHDKDLNGNAVEVVAERPPYQAPPAARAGVVDIDGEPIATLR